MLPLDAIARSRGLSSGSKVDRTLRENYHSEVAGRQMKDSVGAMDFGLFLIVSGQEGRGQKSYQESLQVFTDNLYVEEHNVTLPGEQKLADTLRGSYANYQSAARQLLQITNPAAKRQFYFQRLLLLGDKIKKSARDVVRINEENVLSAPCSFM